MYSYQKRKIEEVLQIKLMTQNDEIKEKIDQIEEKNN